MIPKAEFSATELARKIMAIRPSTNWTEVVRGREEQKVNKQPPGPPGAPSSSPRIFTSKSSFAQVVANQPSYVKEAATPVSKEKVKANPKVYAPLPAD